MSTTYTLRPAVVAYHAYAERSAAENGHTLGEWYESRDLATANRCTQCGASAGLMLDGSPIPASSIDTTCSATLGRYVVRKSGRRFYLHDRERPQFVPSAWHRSLPVARKACDAMNAGTDPAALRAASIADARAKFERAQSNLAKAQSNLDALLMAA